MIEERDGRRAARRAAIGGAVDGLSARLIGVSHALHARPELGGEERFACELLTGALEGEGFEVERAVAGLETAFAARRRLAGPGPRVAFLGEYDALPGLGHACGHNWIAATSLGAALALARAAADLPGEVLLIGTPAEETSGGKVTMVARGVFDPGRVDAALMCHPSNRTVVARTSLASCPLEVEFRGRAAHAAASPEAGVNALDAVVLLLVAVDQVKRSLRDDARVPAIVSHGGDAANVIPELAVARFSLRAADAAYLEHVRERVEDCARGAAIATRCAVSTRLYEPPYRELRASPVLARLFRAELAALGVDETGDRAGGMGSLDIGDVSHRVPALHADLAIAEPGVAAHTPAFALAAASPRADLAIALAARALAGTGLRLLEDPALLAEARGHLAPLPETIEE
jgi:amidohydrolase